MYRIIRNSKNDHLQLFDEINKYLFRLQDANRMQSRRSSIQHSKTQFSGHFGGRRSRASQFLLRCAAELLLDLEHQRAKVEFRPDRRVVAHHVHRDVTRSFQRRETVKCRPRLWFALFRFRLIGRIVLIFYIKFFLKKRITSRIIR